MEAEAGKDVDGEKGGEAGMGEVEKKEQKEEEVVDATGVTSMLLRVTAQTRGGSGETPQKVDEGCWKVRYAARRRRTNANDNFVDEHGAFLG